MSRRRAKARPCPTATKTAWGTEASPVVSSAGVAAALIHAAAATRA